MNTVQTQINRSMASRSFAAADSSGIDLEQLREHVQVVRHRLEAGEYLYRSGQPFRAIYLIRVGSVKTSELADDGREQVTGFRMRGEFVGVEAIGLTTHVCDV